MCIDVCRVALFLQYSHQARVVTRDSAVLRYLSVQLS